MTAKTLFAACTLLVASESAQAQMPPLNFDQAT